MGQSFDQIIMQLLSVWGRAITEVKGMSSMLNEALIIIAGPFFKFTIVEMKGPNKTIISMKYWETGDINATQSCERTQLPLM